MACALCLQNVEVRLSHIIPEFMYSPLYDEKHRFHMRSRTEWDREQLLQKGLRDWLLCDECETKLSRYERYVSHVFNGQVPVQSSQSGRLVQIKGLNYEQFKLFGLSILWRAGVSNIEFFRKVALGPHQEAIRQMIVKGEPGDPSTYGFFLSPVVVQEKDVVEMMVQPTRSRIDGHFCYRFLFGGLVWVFVVSKHKVKQPLRRAFIDKSGRMLMLISELNELDFVVDTMISMAGRA